MNRPCSVLPFTPRCHPAFLFVILSRRRRISERKSYYRVKAARSGKHRSEVLHRFAVQDDKEGGQASARSLVALEGGASPHAHILEAPHFIGRLSGFGWLRRRSGQVLLLKLLFQVREQAYDGIDQLVCVSRDLLYLFL